MTLLQPMITDLLDPVPSAAVRAAATLRLADLISEGNATPATLADASGCEVETLTRLMRYLCTRGVFELNDDGSFILTDVSESLRSDHPSGLLYDLDELGYAGRVRTAIASLHQAVKTGRPVYEDEFGLPFYDDLELNAYRRESFSKSRSATSGIIAPAIANLVQITPGSHIVDVGGGSGHLMTEFLSRCSDATGTIFDLAGMRSAALAQISASGLNQRCRFIAGDARRQVPGADVHVVCDTLFNWDDEQAAQILKAIARATWSSRLIIVERLRRESDPDETTLATDLRLLALFGGSQRTLLQYRELASSAGFRFIKATESSHGVYVIE